VTSFQSKVGLQATVTLNTPSWVIQPVASVSWIHEFENDQRTIEVSFVDDTRAQRFSYLTDSPDRDWGALNLGVVGTLNKRMQAFVNYRAIFGNSMYDNQAVMVGMRVPF
jgi:outer membrane autotransporter protein